MINDDKSFSPTKKEVEMMNMKYLDEVVDIFPKEANNEDFRRSGKRSKRQNNDVDIDRLVMSFDRNTYKS